MAFSESTEEIESLFEEQTKLPVTHRSAPSNRRDDFAKEADGTPVRVPTPETPDDRFN